LLLKTHGSDREVKDSNLDGGLGAVMRVGQRSRQEELEVVVVGDGTLADLDCPVLALFDLLLEKDRLEGGIDVLSDILKEHPFTELNSQLQTSDQVAFRQLEDVQVDSFSVGANLLNELVGLGLGVDHERPPTGAEHNDTVLNGQGITG
jgi:hypothetical protein